MIKHRIAAADTTVEYSISGSGPSLVLVHGTSVDGRANFGHVVDRFADQRTVVCPDYAGCGGSTIPEGSLSLDILVEQVTAVLRATPDGQADLLGDSLGAVVAAATAARHPALVRKLVLVAGWANSHDPRHQMVFKGWARLLDLDAELGNRFALALAVKPAFLTALGPDTLASLCRAPPQPHTRRRIDLGLAIDIREQLAAIQAPTLVVRGASDYLVPEYQTRVLHDRIAGSRYAAVDSGHAVFVEQPAEITALAREFLLS